MKKTIWLFLLALPFIAHSQEQGIHFVHGLNWQQVKEKAKAENKYIFIDCYATWCGPCKMMTRNIFPQKVAGDFFNKNFISVKLQLDTTLNDNDEVKSWYADGKTISDQAGVKSFPTLLFFSPDGEMLHRIQGATSNVAEFVNLAGAAMDTTKQYYTLKKKYQAGDRSPQLLLHASQALLRDDDKNNAMHIFSLYLEAEKNLDFNADLVSTLSSFAQSANGNAFKLLLDNYSKINDPAAKEITNQTIKRLIGQDEIVSKAGDLKAMKVIKWDSLQSGIETKYPAIPHALMNEITSEAKFNYYIFSGEKNKFGEAIVEHMNAYGANASAEELNNAAWEVFQNCKNQSVLNNAINWSKRSLNDSTSAFWDTYANLLYKAGRKQEALASEQKALSLAAENEKTSYRQTLAKMKKGEKTWLD